jgi:carbon monoxide dehydrogenase subunit G
VKVAHTAKVKAPADKLWLAAMDLPAAAQCMPGVAAVTAAGADRYKGSLLVQVGPVRLVLDGDIAVVARDDTARRARLTVDAKDTRLGGNVHASADVSLRAVDTGSEITIDADLDLAGPIATFGAPVIRRKAGQLLAQFAECLARSASRR